MPQLKAPRFPLGEELGAALLPRAAGRNSPSWRSSHCMGREKGEGRLLPELLAHPGHHVRCFPRPALKEPYFQASIVLQALLGVTHGT